MGLRVNFNEVAVNSYRNLASTQAGVAKHVERLSSGYRVNRGADDPAGLVRSEGLRAQLSGLSQALTNSQDAMNMVKTAEGALTEVHTLLRSMRTLAVHASSLGTGNTQTAAADQAQITSALKSIDNIATRTAFGGTKLLDGTSSIGFSMVFGGSGAVGTDIVAVRAASTDSAFLNATGNKAVAIDITQDAAKATTTGGATLAAGAQLSTATTWAAGVSTALTINGVSLGSFAATNTVEDVINSINNNATLSQNIVATRTGNHVVLASKNYGSSEGITIQETITNNSGGALGAAASFIVASGVTTDAALADGASETKTVTAWGTDIKGTVSGNGVGGGTVDFNSGTGFTMKNAFGDEIVFSTGMAGTAAAGDYASTVTGNGNVFQIGSEAGETATVSFASVATTKVGLSASTTFASLGVVDVTTNAQEALKVIDQAIEDVSTMRADMGAFQKNILESTINSLLVTKENVQASESAIRDADMAEEMASFTRYNIMQQAGVAMLAQANQAPQQLLQLLRQ